MRAAEALAEADVGEAAEAGGAAAGSGAHATPGGGRTAIRRAGRAGSEERQVQQRLWPEQWRCSAPGPCRWRVLQLLHHSTGHAPGLNASSSAVCVEVQPPSDAAWAQPAVHWCSMPQGCRPQAACKHGAADPGQAAREQAQLAYAPSSTPVSWTGPAAAGSS